MFRSAVRRGHRFADVFDVRRECGGDAGPRSCVAWHHDRFGLGSRHRHGGTSRCDRAAGQDDRRYRNRHRQCLSQREQRTCPRDTCDAAAAVVTQFPLGTPPLKDNFPYRNRIISGLSFGVLIVEASERSGSLITARLAMEQNREVMAVPGNITSGNSFGTNYLIKSGAKLVQQWQDVVAELPSEIAASILPPKIDEAAPRRHERPAAGIDPGRSERERTKVWSLLTAGRFDTYRHFARDRAGCHSAI